MKQAKISRRENPFLFISSYNKFISSSRVYRSSQQQRRDNPASASLKTPLKNSHRITYSNKFVKQSCGCAVRQALRKYTKQTNVPQNKSALVHVSIQGRWKCALENDCVLTKYVYIYALCFTLSGSC